MILKSAGIDLSSIQRTFESDLKKLAVFAESIDMRLARIENHLGIKEIAHDVGTNGKSNGSGD